MLKYLIAINNDLFIKDDYAPALYKFRDEVRKELKAVDEVPICKTVTTLDDVIKALVATWFDYRSGEFEKAQVAFRELDDTDKYIVYRDNDVSHGILCKTYAEAKAVLNKNLTRYAINNQGQYDVLSNCDTDCVLFNFEKDVATSFNIKELKIGGVS